MSTEQSTARRKRFHDRIATEREILGIINSSDLCNGLPLAGMTSNAIKDWERRARMQLGQGQAAKIANLLIELGKHTELLADDSRDVFRVGELVHYADIGKIKSELQQAVSC